MPIFIFITEDTIQYNLQNTVGYNLFITDSQFKNSDLCGVAETNKAPTYRNVWLAS